MKNFEKHLQNKGFTQSTILTYVYLASKYLSFVKSKRLTVKQAKYNTVLKYINYLNNRNSSSSVNLHLISIRHYYAFLKVKNNPVSIHIKRKATVISSNTLNSSLLHQLYDNFKVNDSITSFRDKITLGLFVFQGIHSYEIKNIQINDVDFTNMKIYIKQSKRSNSRLLDIHIKQLLDLNNYIDNVRNQFNNNNNSLITTNSNKNCIKSILYQLSKKLKKQKVDYRIIRTSVIRNWLKHTNLRKVQYFSGHRYISSTERYITTDIEKLKENIVKYHPF